MIVRKNTLLVNEKKNLNYLVCNVSRCGEFAALADMNIVLKKNNAPKPKAFKANDLKAFVKKHSLECQRYSKPPEMTFSDEWIKEKRPKWLAKRDKKFNEIAPISSLSLIEEYLYGGGLADEIDSLLPKSEWTSKGAFYNALNRYVSLGSTKNALLPVGLKYVGTYYEMPDKPRLGNVKRGRGGADNRNTPSQTREVTKEDIEKIKQVLAAFKRADGDFTFAIAYDVFNRQFQRNEVIRNIGDRESSFFIPFDEKDTISLDQFTYHAKKILSNADLHRIKCGQISFEKDWKDRQGSAHDGVLYATDVYEVDATQLDCYIRYPYDTTKQLTSGRPWLYIVIDVASTMVVGMYLGFDGPNVNGAQQALANACLDKVEFAARYGLGITADCFPAKHIPNRITIDNGKEYPNGFISGVLNSNLGIEMFDILPAYRGDGKGTNEGFFNVMNKKVIHFLKGAIHKRMRKEQQHPSNFPIYDYDAMVALILNEIIVLNNSSERMSKLSFQAVRDNITPTPRGIFMNSLKYDLDGDPGTSPEDECEIRWAFLPEEQATVRSDGIYFDGLKYQSAYAKQNGWHTLAKSRAFKIIVKRVRDWTNTIWHKTPDGEYIELELHNPNNESPFLDGHWEMIEQLKVDLRERRHALKQDARYTRAMADARFKYIHEQNIEEVALSPENTTKSIQKGIKDRFERNKRIVAADEMLQLTELFFKQNKPVLVEQFHDESSDDDMF